MLLKTFSCDKRRQKCEEQKDGGLKVPLFDLSAAMSCLEAKISLAPKHQLMVPSTLLAPATHIPTDKATKPQRYIRSHL